MWKWKIAIAATFVAVSPAAAQQPGTALQLPTFRSFSVSTSVLVPDSGSAYAGGVGHYGSGGSSYGFGPIRNRSFGTTAGASSLHITAQIHDFAEYDRQILAEAERRRGAYVLRPEVTSSDVASQPHVMETDAPLLLGSSASTPPQASVSELRRQQQIQDQARERERLNLLEKARRAEAEGKPGVAKIYRQMAARRE